MEITCFRRENIGAAAAIARGELDAERKFLPFLPFADIPNSDGLAGNALGFALLTAGELSDISADLRSGIFSARESPGSGRLYTRAVLYVMTVSTAEWYLRGYIRRRPKNGSVSARDTILLRFSRTIPSG